MRLFHAQIIDEVLEGDATTAECSLAWSYLLPRAESLKFTCVVDQVSGTAPTFSLDLYEGTAADFRLMTHLVPASGIPATLSGAYSITDPTYPPGRYLVPIATLNGSNGPKAHVRIWACGRGPQLLEAMPGQASLAVMYQAARMIEDEDRLPARKRSLKQGASAAHSAALFDPALRWDR